jgi:hypothetical protein
VAGVAGVAAVAEVEAVAVAAEAEAGVVEAEVEAEVVEAEAEAAVAAVRQALPPVGRPAGQSCCDGSLGRAPSWHLCRRRST